MRSTPDRDDLGAKPGMSRLHVDVCGRTQTAVAQLAQHDGIGHTAALCRLIRYGDLIARTARDDDTLGTAAWEVSLPGGDHAVLVRRADLPRRRWWWPFSRRYRVLPLTLADELDHDDNRLVIE